MALERLERRPQRAQDARADGGAGRGRVAGRDGREQLWDLAERVYPDDGWPRGDALRLRGGGDFASLGIARRKATRSARRTDRCGRGRRAGRREGVRGPWRSTRRSSTAVRGPGAIFSPIDRLVVDRKRMAELFDFDTSWRCSSPWPNAGGATGRCRCCTATGWSASSTPPPSASGRAARRRDPRGRALGPPRAAGPGRGRVAVPLARPRRGGRARLNGSMRAARRRRVARPWCSDGQVLDHRRPAARLGVPLAELARTATGRGGARRQQRPDGTVDAATGVRSDRLLVGRPVRMAGGDRGRRCGVRRARPIGRTHPSWSRPCSPSVRGVDARVVLLVGAGRGLPGPGRMGAARAERAGTRQRARRGPSCGRAGSCRSSPIRASTATRSSDAGGCRSPAAARDGRPGSTPATSRPSRERALLEEGHAGQVYEIAGPEALSLPRVADAALGRFRTRGPSSGAGRSRRPWRGPPASTGTSSC